MSPLSRQPLDVLIWCFDRNIMIKRSWMIDILTVDGSATNVIQHRDFLRLWDYLVNKILFNCVSTQSQKKKKIYKTSEQQGSFCRKVFVLLWIWLKAERLLCDSLLGVETRLDDTVLDLTLLFISPAASFLAPFLWLSTRRPDSDCVT